ncbi:MAG: type IV secretion system protein [Solirubrobacteraceae bacterium]
MTLLLLAWPAAIGKYRGSDLLDNVSPESQAGGGLADRYPLSAYALDYHVDVGVTEPEGVPPMIAQWAAAQLWSATSLLVKATIDLFTWAFSLDLLGGATGALAPIAEAITSLYENVIGEAWMVVAILIAGIWGIWKALVQRRYTETAGALGVSVLFVLIALFFVYQPERTIGEASRWTNTLSLAFLSGANRGSLDDPQQAKHQVADHLFQTLVYQPWVVLEFGGLRHCVDSGRLDDDGFPRPVGPHDPTRDVCRDHMRPSREGYGGYAPRYLAQRPGSEERKAEYEALRDDEVPDPEPRRGDPDSETRDQFAGYRVDKADAPAVDAQQAGGAFQRLTFSVVVFLGALGAIALLGFLSLAVMLAQVVALVLLGFAPVALIIGIFPGAGHEFFRGWLAKLATAVFIKALYSLVIAIVVAVSAALTAATDSLGFLFAFGLQTLFFWAIFIYRKQITARLVAATTGAPANERLPRTNVVQKGAHIATHPFTALIGATRHGASERAGKQDSALSGAASADGSSSATPTGGAGAHAQPTSASANGHARTASGDRHASAPIASSGNGGSGRRPAGEPLRANDAPSNSVLAASTDGLADSPEQRYSTSHPRTAPGAPATAATQAVRRDPDAPDATPRTSHEDVMRRARKLRERQRETVPSGEQDRG